MSFLSSLFAKDRYVQGFPVLPGKLPLVGHIPSLVFDALGALRRAHDRLGPVMWVHLGPDNRTLFLLGRDSFELLKHKSATIRGAFLGLERMIGESAIAQDGAAHTRVRGALNPTFSMRGLVSTGTGNVMAATIAARVESWVQKRRVSALKETQELALDIIFRVAGVPTDALPEWHRQNREVALMMMPLRADFPGSPRRRAMRAADWIDAGLQKIVTHARQNPQATGFTHALVAARDEEGNGLSDLEIVDNLRVLLFAGHETTASALAWLTLILAQRPELWEQLCREVQLVGGAIPASIADAKHYPFGEALLREVLRRYSPIWFTRRMLTEDLHYAGHHIPAGTSVALCIGSYLNDPALYANPECFDPSRWLGRPTSPTPIEMAGFGGGAHFCLGYHLAWLEVQQFLVALAQKMSAAGLRPRMPDGPGPREIFFPVRHPGGGTHVEFVPN